MSDDKLGLAAPVRPEVNLRTPSVSPVVVARPISVGTPGTGISENIATAQLLRSLQVATDQFSAAGKDLLKENRADQLREGQLAAMKNQLDWSSAVDKGLVDTTANPWFIKGYQEQDGRVAGLTYYSDMRAAYTNSPAKGSDDPKVYQQFVGDFTKQWMETHAAGKTTEWQAGFGVTSQSAQAQLNAEHAQQAEATVINTQKTNTGAEINAILNTTPDPKQAGALINALGTKMRAMGMLQKDFEEVAATAVLAKAKLGNGDYLKTLDYVTTGGASSDAANDQLRIKKMESRGGDYSAIGPEVTYPDGTKDHAYGAYGIMGKNIPAWTKEVLGKEMTPAQFAADQGAQDKVFDAKYGALKAKYGEDGANRAWFAGEGGMNDLNRRDVNGMTVGRYSTLASDPKVAAARVDTQNFLTEKARGDTRWAWAQDDHDWSLKQREWAKQQHEYLLTEQERQSATWGRADKARNLQSQIMTSTMEDPANAYANNKTSLEYLAKFDPAAAREASSFIDGFLSRREHIPDAVEKPVLAQLTSDMVAAAGSPERQQQLMMSISQQFRDNKLNRDTMMKLMDDAQRLASFDPGALRKLNAGSVVEVKKSIDGFYTKEGSISLTGSKALDALYAKQTVDRAVIEALKVNPNVSEDQLGAIAMQSLRNYLTTTGAGSLLGTGDVEKMTGQAAAGAGRAAQKTENTIGSAPAAPPTTEQALGAIPPEQVAAAVQSFHAAFSRSPVEGVKALADFDARVGVPGLGRMILERNAQPAAPPTPAKR